MTFKKPEKSVMYEKNFQIDFKFFHKSIDIVHLTWFDAIATPIGILSMA